MRSLFLPIFFCFFFYACHEGKTLAKSSFHSSNDTLIQLVNQSKKDTGHINTTLNKLAKENDLIIAFATLNYAWTRTGTYHILVLKNKQWKLYSYQSKLSSALNDSIPQIDSINLIDSTAEKIKQLYASSQLWNINGGENKLFCNNKKDCNITDAETWTLTIATPQNIHTTTYYAPDFFESCCPGNSYRHSFVAIVKEIEKIVSNMNSM